MSEFLKRRREKLTADGYHGLVKALLAHEEQGGHLEQVRLITPQLAKESAKYIQDTLKNVSFEKLPSEVLVVLQRIRDMEYNACVLALSNASAADIRKKPLYFSALADRIDGHEVSPSDSRSILDTLAFVRSVLTSFVFLISAPTRDSKRRMVTDMTVEARDSALRYATEENIRKDPVYYSMLVDKHISHLDALYQETRDKIKNLEAFLQTALNGRVLSADPHDRLLVAGMNLVELRAALDTVTLDKVKRRESFYQALFDRSVKEY